MIFMPLQCRMARAALGLGIRELALAAKVSIDTITRFERGDQLKERTIEAIQRALEAAGVEFTNGEQPGVRLSRTERLPARPKRPSLRKKAAIEQHNAVRKGDRNFNSLVCLLAAVVEFAENCGSGATRKQNSVRVDG